MRLKRRLSNLNPCVFKLLATRLATVTNTHACHFYGVTCVQFQPSLHISDGQELISIDVQELFLFCPNSLVDGYTRG